MEHPLVVSYGVGWDSTAMLVAMHDMGIRPDLILFADTGAEKPETYAYIPVMNAWLESVGFPQITIVRYVPTRAPYSTLEDKCLANETLPSLAFGHHSCAIVFKHGPQDKFVEQWQPAVDAWAAGIKVIRAIGYDDGEQDNRRRDKADRACARKAEQGDKDATRYDYWYPLQDWRIDREECQRLILSAGLPLPVKSACYFCPASKKSEIVWLRDTHPVLFHRALTIEQRSNEGKHNAKRIAEGQNISTKGLGRTFAWADLAHVDATVIVDDEAETLRP